MLHTMGATRGRAFARSLGACVLMCALWLSGAASVSAQDRRSSPGVYEGYSEEIYDGWTRSSQYVSARDGVRLAVTIYRPTRAGQPASENLPVLFTFTPYLSRRTNAEGVVVGAVEGARGSSRPFVELTRYGYVVAVADVRGTGSSFGVRLAYADQNEANDGHDLVEWLASQQWSNGHVGMFGCSYVGGVQWATARTAPPHLRAIFPHAAQFDSYRNVRRGGIAGQFNTRPRDVAEDYPTAPVDGDDGSLRAAALRQHEANGQMSEIVEALPYRDDRRPFDDVQYWPLSSPYPMIEEIRRQGIAVYAWGSWLDEPADQSIIAFENMRDGGALTKLMMSPGGHCDPGGIDSFAEHLRFFDHVLKGVDNGINREPPVYFSTSGYNGDTQWSFAPSFPLTEAPAQTFHLASGGALGRTPTRRLSTTRFEVRYDVGCTPPAWAMPPALTPEAQPGGLPPPGYWPCVDASKAITFSTAAFERDMWLSGFSTLTLRLRSSSPEAYVFAYLETVSPDGGAELIAHGRLQASHRALGESPYRNLDLPWHPSTRSAAAPLRPGQAADLVFELSPTSRIIPAGHALRLSIAGADQRQRNLPLIRIEPAPVLDILTGGADGSRLSMTLVPAEHLANAGAAP